MSTYINVLSIISFILDSMDLTECLRLPNSVCVAIKYNIVTVFLLPSYCGCGEGGVCFSSSFQEIELLIHHMAPFDHLLRDTSLSVLEAIREAVISSDNPILFLHTKRGKGG
jgi:hypothetical protein